MLQCLQVPPFCYFEPDSLIAQQQVVYLREVLGIPAYYTMDAGPNVKSAL